MIETAWTEAEQETTFYWIPEKVIFPYGENILNMAAELEEVVFSLEQLPERIVIRRIGARKIPVSYLSKVIV